MEDTECCISPAEAKPQSGNQLLTTKPSNEDTPLVVKKRISPWWSRCVLRYRNTHKCVSSKSALLILFWSFIIGLWYAMFLSYDFENISFLTLINRSILSWLLLGGYGFVAIVFCFFPLAGFLADVKYGRYKTTLRSLLLVLISIPCFIVLGSIGTGLVFLFGLTVTVTILFSVFCFLAFITLVIGLTGFTANVIQFGMDQLHDSPGEDRTLFIHWYVWGSFATVTISQLGWNLAIQLPYKIVLMSYSNYIGFALLASIILFVLAFLIITLCLARRRRSWFLIEPGRVNPYKLVYRVTKFAYQHKTPVHRSAFTYCEDEIPRGLDLGKEKYGGSFTTEQVEDVKVFYGILKVLFSFGTVFFLDFAASFVIPIYAFHSSSHFYDGTSVIFNGTLPQQIILNHGLLSPLLISICIPLYLCLLRPLSQYVPGMLKRMGFGIIFTLLSLIASFTMDTVGHMRSEPNTTSCMFTYFVDSIYYNNIDVPIPLDTLLLTIQLTLSALSHMLIYTAVFEFICSQSPHSMKGLLIGLLYAIKGLYQLLATLLVVPFAVGYLHHSSDHFSCGFYYYLVNIVVGLIAVAVYVCVAKRYRYRERDEICNIHRYAEEYYSSPLNEH